MFARAILVNQKTVRDKLDGFETSSAAKGDLAAYKEGVQMRIDAIKKSRRPTEPTSRESSEPCRPKSRSSAEERRLRSRASAHQGRLVV